jgi:DNA-binding XRE family transcriptional regulator
MLPHITRWPANLLVVFLLVELYKLGGAKFFDRLGERVRKFRKARGLSQEDMISFGFSARHWQQIEAGRPITVTTLLRICEAFHVPVARLLQGMDKGIY